MPAPRTAARRPRFWLPAVVLAIGVHALAFFALGVSSVHNELHRTVPRGIRWVGERADEAIEVRDPKALFLPTRWNAAARQASETDNRGPGEIFGLVERTPLIAKGAIPAGLLMLPEGIRTAGVAISRFSLPYFSAFGQEDDPIFRLSPRAAEIEVRVATSGELVLRWELPVTEAVAAGADTKRWPFWAPFEMLIAVESTGMVGVPHVAAPGSGADVVDDFFRTNLRSLLRPDLRLPPGYYRVVVGP